MSSSPSSRHSASAALFCEETAEFDSPPWISDLRPESPPLDDCSVDRLLSSEHQFLPESDYLRRCRDRIIDSTVRQDSINWILKVSSFYHFRPATAFLAVNYFDRFLSSHSLPGNRWPFQLLAVACLSLAAKMEEIQVPPLLDLQVLEPGFVFGPKTVQRMELLVMANLDWRLRSITPFDYLSHFISTVPSLQPDCFNRILAVSSDLILSTTRVIDFLGFRPSTVAAAAVLCAAGEGVEVPPASERLFHEKIDKEMVRSCHQLMQEYLIDTCPSARLKHAPPEPPSDPPSPVGVLDAAACRSCDTRSENPGSVSQAEDNPTVKRPRSFTPDVQQP